GIWNRSSGSSTPSPSGPLSQMATLLHTDRAVFPVRRHALARGRPTALRPKRRRSPAFAGGLTLLSPSWIHLAEILLHRAARLWGGLQPAADFNRPACDVAHTPKRPIKIGHRLKPAPQKVIAARRRIARRRS